MTKSKTFRLTTIDRAELKLLSKFFNCSETMVVQIALGRLANKFIPNKELDEKIEIMRKDEMSKIITTYEYLRDKS